MVLFFFQLLRFSILLWNASEGCNAIDDIPPSTWLRLLYEAIGYSRMYPPPLFTLNFVLLSPFLSFFFFFLSFISLISSTIQHTSINRPGFSSPQVYNNNPLRPSPPARSGKEQFRLSQFPKFSRSRLCARKKQGQRK